MTDSLLTSSKFVKELVKKIEKFYDKDNGIKFKKWLDDLKVYNIVDNKIPGLLNNSKIGVETKTDTGIYNLILLWIMENNDKFKDYDFDGIPKSTFINIKEDIKKDIQNVTQKLKKIEFKTQDDVKNWCENPTINPLTGKTMSPMSNEYSNIWTKSFRIWKKILKNDKTILDNFLPKDHLLFNKFDFLYFAETKNDNTKKFEDDLSIYILLTVNIENTEQKDTAFETEIELFRNRFDESNSNSQQFHILMSEYINDIVNRLLNYKFEYKKHNIEYIIDVFPRSLIKEFLKFVNEEKFSNGINILEYFKNEKRKSNCPQWIKELLILVDTFYKCYNDINDLITPDLDNPNSVVDNYEDKTFKLIEDPIENYFKKYEDALEFLKNDKYKRLINHVTLKPIDKKNYLNDSENAQFQKLYISKDNTRKTQVSLYDTKYNEYEKLKKTNTNAKSPSPPKQRFTIDLPNGKTYINGQEKPLHILDSIVKSFNKDYDKSKKDIDEYAKIKNMPYLQLVKYVEKSPSRQIKDLAKNNILFSMSREQINNDILYDEYVEETELADRCNDSNDILTKQDFDSEDYPLAKLQLLVRLKINYKDKHKTECIYAPSLYNYLVQCINNKQPFINPLTRVQYTEEHINELMNVMKIINPNIEKPFLSKPLNDKKFIIDYNVITSGRQTYNPLGLEFWSIDLYRQFGETKYLIYHLCTIPSNIEPTGTFATGSSDISSTAMLFKIFKLFNDGRLFNKYVPPYCITYMGANRETYLSYIALQIHFNNYKKIYDWLDIDKEKIVEMFKHYAEEINNYIYH